MNSVFFAEVPRRDGAFVDFGGLSAYMQLIDPRRVTLSTLAVAPDVCSSLRKIAARRGRSTRAICIGDGAWLSVQ